MQDPNNRDTAVAPIPVPFYLRPLVWLGAALLLAGAGLVWHGKYAAALPPVVLADLDDQGLEMQLDQLGPGIRVVNFWASWCLPCRIEHPNIQALAERFPGAVVGVNHLDDPEDARQWLAYFGNPYTRVLHDPEGLAGDALGLQGIPYTLVLDEAGSIIYHHGGPLTLQQVEEQLVPLLSR